MRAFHSGFGAIVILILVAILLLGGGVFLFVTQEKDATVIENEKTEDNAVMEGEKMEKNDSMMEEDVMMPVSPDDAMQGGEDTGIHIQFTGTLLAGSKTLLLDFTKSDYDTALASKKVIVLYFYANWCPICKAEFPKAQSAFDELHSSDIVGFRVNFNDNETDQHEKDLAREFGVAYQHTKVILKNGERVLKSPESWEKNRYLSEINSFVTN